MGMTLVPKHFMTEINLNDYGSAIQVIIFTVRVFLTVLHWQQDRALQLWCTHIKMFKRNISLGSFIILTKILNLKK